MARGTARLLALTVLAWPPPAGLAGQELWLARVPIGSVAGVDSLARLGFEVADVLSGPSPDGLNAVVVVSRETESLIRSSGRAALLLPSPPRPAAPATYSVYRGFDDPARGIRATLEALEASRTNVFVDSIGASVEGRPILVVKIGLPGAGLDRPDVYFLATHHAREWVSTEMAMALIHYLADSLSLGSDSTLLRTRDIWVVPVVNPDGYQYSFTSGNRLWRKNRRPNGDGTFGVDLNRNYPAFWGLDDVGSSPATFAETYRGTAPASEPEVQAMIEFHSVNPPRVAVSYHSFSDLVLYPYGFRPGQLAPDLPVFRALAGTALVPAVRDGVPESSRLHYHGGPSWILYPVNGEYTDWTYRMYGTLAFTVELTAGCCASGQYYGFEFPDDSALVAQVVRDNLPFALAALRAAANPELAAGASGLQPTPRRLEAMWPEAWANLGRNDPGPAALALRSVTGANSTASFVSDSLDRGRLRAWWRAPVPDGTLPPHAARVEGPDWVAETLLSGGAEASDSGWTGFTRTSEPPSPAGSASWMALTDDTLTSPVVDLRTRSAVWLQFWTRHRGSVFIRDQRGVVQFSPDSGRTWQDVEWIVGDGPGWYPVRVDLPTAAGTPGARLRFIARGLEWWLDAVSLLTDRTNLFASVVEPSTLLVSANPVRGTEVVFSWPPSSSEAQVFVFSFRGERLFSASLPTGVSEYVWDLRAAGRPVVNGAYIVVVKVGERLYRRRLFVARASP